MIRVNTLNFNLVLTFTTSHDIPGWELFLKEVKIRVGGFLKTGEGGEMFK